VNDIGYVEVAPGIVWRADPARPPAVTVVRDKAEKAHFPVGSDEFLREVLHGSVNGEIQSLEIAAQSIADFPDAAWELRLDLARQCWDEVRHARLFLGRLLARQGWVGEYPVMNGEWAAVCAFDSLAARLAVQNRLFEAGSLDVLGDEVQVWRDLGDEETAEVMDTVLADEVAHVASGVGWLERLGRDNPRVMLDAVAAMNRVRGWKRAMAAPGQAAAVDITVNTEDRRRAGLVS